MKTIELSEPITVTLTPAEVLAIVTGLKELPYKHAHPVIEHLYEACQPKEPSDGQPQP